MANKFQAKRTTVSGRLPNTTNSSNAAYIDAGEFAINLTDKKLVSSDGSLPFEIGSNLSILSVTGNVTISGVIVANGGTGSAGHVLKSTGSGSMYWAAVTGGSSVNIYASAPSSPSAADLWWNTEDGNLYIYYNDGTSSQWVSTNVPVQGPPGVNAVIAGANTQIQFNNSGVLGASANFAFDTATSLLTIGNTTVNAIANSSLIKIANSTVSTNLSITGLVSGISLVNSTGLFVGANVVVNASTVFIGNSTANATHNSILVQVSNSTFTSNLTPASLTIGTTVVNSTGISIAANTGLAAGAVATTANGYTWLTNGILLQWGVVSANSTVGNVTFPTTFPNALLSITATTVSTVTGQTYAALLLAANTSTANVRTSNGTARSVYWQALGR